MKKLLVSIAFLASALPSHAVLGDYTKDLVYTPVTPCRIIDTRSAGGAIPALGTRNFVAYGVSSYTSQGGSATNCGMMTISATAVAVNVTAVSPAAAGWATLYPYGTAQPAVSSINYAAGAVVNNALIVQTPNPTSSWDFTVFSQAQSHYVADIVGYFAPPQPTALHCVETTKTTVSLPASGGTGNAGAPACAAGYTQTATNCETSSWATPLVFSSNGVCSARNNSGAVESVTASRTCCRVPGR